MNQVILTPYGKLRLQAEIEVIRLNELPRVKKRLQNAESLGNEALISDSKAELEFYENRIPYIENMLATAKIIGGTEETANDM